jgi:hypothetical protein
LIDYARRWEVMLMTRSYLVIGSGALAMTCGVLFAPACSNSSDNGSGVPDAATPDSSAPDSTAVDASHDAAADARDAAPADASDAATCTLFDAGELDPNLVDAGRQLAAAKCAHCHQPEPADSGLFLTGRTLDSGLLVDDGGLFVYPPDLTSDPGALGCWTNDQIANAILHGIDNQDAALCVTMPHWAAIFGADGGDSDAAAAELVAALRSLTPAPNPTPHDLLCAEAPDGAPLYPPDAATVDSSAADAASEDGGDATVEDAADAALADAADGSTLDASDASTEDAGDAEPALDAGDAGDGS